MLIGTQWASVTNYQSRFIAITYVFVCLFVCFHWKIEVEKADEAAVAKNETSLYDYLTAEVVSTVVGAALGEQDCLRRSACEAGNYVSEVSGKEIALM